MAWFSPEDVAAVYPDAVLSEAQVEHIQSLAEGCIGVHDEVPGSVVAVLVDVAYRFFQSLTTNPEGFTQEQTGPFGRSFGSQPARGLTDRDCQQLRLAMGIGSLSTVSTTRGPVEMARSRE